MHSLKFPTDRESARHVLNVVKLGEQAARVGSSQAVEFDAGLFAQVGPIDQKQNPAGFGVLDQPIGDSACFVGLSSSGCHVNQGSRAVMGEGVFQSFDGFNLAISHAVRHERVFGRHCSEAGPERIRFFRPFGQCLGAMEGKDTAGATVWISRIAEERLDAGGFVQKRKRPGGSSGEQIGQAGGVAGGLIGDG